MPIFSIFAVTQSNTNEHEKQSAITHHILRNSRRNIHHGGPQEEKGNTTEVGCTTLAPYLRPYKQPFRAPASCDSTPLQALPHDPSIYPSSDLEEGGGEHWRG